MNLDEIMRLSEDTVICVDNSVNMLFNLDMYDDQVRAVRRYAQAKLRSCGLNLVGVIPLGLSYPRLLTHPCRYTPSYLELISLSRSGYLDLEYGLPAACDSLQTCGNRSKKRILLFVGSPLAFQFHMKFYLTEGRKLKEKGVAIDIVCFNEFPSHDNRRRCYIEAFIDAANHNGNCHILYVPPKSSICDALCRDPKIFPTRFIWNQGVIAHKMEDVNVEPSCKGKNQDVEAHRMEDNKLDIVEKQEKDVNVEPSRKGKKQDVEAQEMVELELELSRILSHMNHHSSDSPKGRTKKKRKGKKPSSKGKVIVEKQEKDVKREPSCNTKNQDVEALRMEDNKLVIVEKQEKDVNVEPSHKGKNQHAEAHGMMEQELSCMGHHSIDSPKGKKKKKRGEKPSSKGKNQDVEAHRMDDNKLVIVEKQEKDVNVEPSHGGRINMLKHTVWWN